MQYSTLALGSAIIIYVIYIAFTTIKSPEELIKLKYMRSKFGAKTGTIIHSVVYIVVPLIFAYFVMIAGVEGSTIKQFITGQQ